MTTPRQTMAEQAHARAELARRNQQYAEAAAYDALAGELRGPSDLATATRLLADDYQEAGYVELPDWLRALADIHEGRFPCGHETRVVTVAEGQARVRGEDELGIDISEPQDDPPPDMTAEEAMREMGLRPVNEPLLLPPTPAQNIRNDEAARKALDTSSKEK